MAPSDTIPPDVGQLAMEAAGDLANTFPVEDVAEIAPPLPTPDPATEWVADPSDSDGYGAMLQAEMDAGPSESDIGPFPVEEVEEIGPPLPTPDIDIEP